MLYRAVGRSENLEGGAVVMWWAQSAPPSSDRVNWLVKIRECQAPPTPLASTVCFMKWIFELYVLGGAKFPRITFGIDISLILIHWTLYYRRFIDIIFLVICLLLLILILWHYEFITVAHVHISLFFLRNTNVGLSCLLLRLLQNSFARAAKAM